MAGNYNDGNDYTIAEQVKFASFMVQSLTKAGIPFAVNSDTKFYDRENHVWIDQMLPLRQCIYGGVSDSGQNEKETANCSAGFNAKGSLDTKDQYAYVRKQFENLKKAGADTKKIMIRLNGGTISQQTYSKDWTDSEIACWAKLQKAYGCKYIFVVNFNDTAQNQLKFFRRMRKAGVKFSMIELGNEQYLPKFAESKTSYKEVTKRTSAMTPEKYIRLCNEYIRLLKKYDLPFYIQFASESERNAKAYQAWNTAIIQAINGKKFASGRIHGAIHLYERNGAGSLNEDQIGNLKKV